MSPSNANPNEEEVLLAFSVEPKRDRSTLERYLADYPEHSEALVACSLELMTRPAELSPVWVPPGTLDAQWHRFRAELRTTAGATPAESPFARLTPASFKEVARRLDINSLLLMRIRDRGVRAASIPRAFLRELAKELGAPLATVADYLAGQPSVAPASAFRAASKPTATGQVDFSDAIKTSHISAEQQKRLLALGD